jgi:nitrite reductase (NO-forming)
MLEIQGIRYVWTLVLALAMTSAALTAAHAAPQAKSPKAKSGSSQAKSSAASGAAPRAVLTDAPTVPPPITRRFPAKLVVELEVSEVTLPIADGVDYTF